MSRPPKPKYRTTNWSAYNEFLQQRGALLWIDKGMEWAGAIIGKRGREPKTISCGRPSVLDGQSGRSGVVTTEVAWWKPRCAASNYSASA